MNVITVKKETYDAIKLKGGVEITLWGSVVLIIEGFMFTALPTNADEKTKNDVSVG